MEVEFNKEFIYCKVSELVIKVGIIQSSHVKELSIILYKYKN